MTAELDRIAPEWRDRHPDIAQTTDEWLHCGPLPVDRASEVLVHGDYFSANILPTSAGIRIIDWETFGLGDPAWDLGFLIGADPSVSDEEVDDVIEAYTQTAPLDKTRLEWHRTNWGLAHRLRQTLKVERQSPQ